MTVYARMIDETAIEFPPKNKGAVCNYDTNVDLLTADGYKPYIEAETDPKKVYSFTYKDLGNSILQIATEVIQPTPEEVREEQFERDFFETSLGWIRRKATMQDGTQKDFLSDLFPTMAFNVSLGVTVNVLTYTKPNDFSEEITDWTQFQHWKVVTNQFIQECSLQLQNDFIPIN